MGICLLDILPDASGYLTWEYPLGNALACLGFVVLLFVDKLVLGQSRPFEEDNMKGLVLFVGLSIHGVLEGLAVGLQTQTAALLRLGVAVSVHKFPATLALALALEECWFLVLGFSLMAPIGITLGVVCTCFKSVFLEGVLLGLAGGSFLYIAIVEILTEELTTEKHKGWKFVSFSLGISFVAALMVLEL